MKADLNWRIERACAAAFPPVRCETVGDWNVAVSGCTRRRINSASPRGPGATLDTATVARIAAVYAGQDARVRVPDLVEVDEVLNAAGFAPASGRTRTLGRVLERTPAPDAGVILTTGPDPAWLATRSALSLEIAGVAEDYAPALSRLSVPAAFARIGDAAVAYAAVAEGVLVLEAVATHPDARRQGYARRCITALLHWGAGASHAALQVAAGNIHAIALYRRIGFLCDHYGYHYRERAGCPKCA